MYKPNLSIEYGVYNLISAWLSRLIWLIFLIPILLNFHKNPTGLSILIILVLILLVRVKTEQITIDINEIVFIRKFFFSIIPVRASIKIDEISGLEVYGNRNLKNNIILLLLPFSYVRNRNTVSVNLKNGDSVDFRTDIFIEKLNDLELLFENIGSKPQIDSE